MALWWEGLSDVDLLMVPIKDLDLELNKSVIPKYLKNLIKELKKKKIKFKPHVWISDEWMSPDGYSGFGIPFYMVHPRLINLEKKLMGGCEGATDREFKMLFRHEAAHAIDNAFHLRKNKSRQKLFGLSSTPYPSSYDIQKYSRNFVRHFSQGYAQSHPDEDWAETFAVWLDPNSNWKNRYQNWACIEKLQLVEDIMDSVRDTEPLKCNDAEYYTLKDMDETLGEFYERRVKSHEAKEFFMPQIEASKRLSKTGSRDLNLFLEIYEKKLKNIISEETGYKKYLVSKAIDHMALEVYGKNIRIHKTQSALEEIQIIISEGLPSFLKRKLHHYPM